MDITSIEELVEIFRTEPFTIKVEGSFVDAGIVIISIQFMFLTTTPIPDISMGDDDVLSLTYWIDINELINLSNNSYRTTSGKWIHGVLPQVMINTLSSKLVEAEMSDEKNYAYVEYILEYYFQYVTLYPEVEEIDIEGDTYHNQKGLNISDDDRTKMLSFFHLHKSRELYRMFGIDAVHWINFIRDEIKHTPKHDDTQANEEEKMLLAIKRKAKLLRASIKEVDATEESTASNENHI